MAARTPLVPTSTANTLIACLLSPSPQATSFDGGNATIRGGGTRIPNASSCSRGSTMRRWAVRVDPEARKRPVTGPWADQLDPGPGMSPGVGGMQL